MRFLILIHSNPKSRALWETLTDEQRMAFGRGHLKLNDQIDAAGELICSEGLPDPSMSTFVSVRDGQLVASDGPFAEAKEYLAGFYLVDCSKEKALEWAARAPDTQLGGEVEVRPVFDLSYLQD